MRWITRSPWSGSRFRHRIGLIVSWKARMTRITGSLRDSCLLRHRVRFIVGRSSRMEGIAWSLGSPSN